MVIFIPSSWIFYMGHKVCGNFLKSRWFCKSGFFKGDQIRESHLPKWKHVDDGKLPQECDHVQAEYSVRLTISDQWFMRLIIPYLPRYLITWNIFNLVVSTLLVLPNMSDELALSPKTVFWLHKLIHFLFVDVFHGLVIPMRMEVPWDSPRVDPGRFYVRPPKMEPRRQREEAPSPRSRGERILFLDRIQIRIIFGIRILTEYEYKWYLFFRMSEYKYE